MTAPDAPNDDEWSGKNVGKAVGQSAVELGLAGLILAIPGVLYWLLRRTVLRRRSA